MKNCIIIHGGPLTDVLEEPHKLHTLYWQPWTKAALEKHDIPTFLPAMPHPWNPKYKEWKEVIEKLPVTAESVLIGHSRGVADFVTASHKHWLEVDEKHRDNPMRAFQLGSKEHEYPINMPMIEEYHHRWDLLR